MHRWVLPIELDHSGKLPLFLQLAGAIAEAIRSGRLKPGEALPGSRELSSLLGVNRKTVGASYDELAAEGLVTARVGGGTYVAALAVPSFAPPEPPNDLPAYELPPIIEASPRLSAPAPGTLFIANGMPDARLFPAAALARAFRRAMGSLGHSLVCADPIGHPRLRTELAAMLARTRGLPATSTNILITQSIEQAIDLVARMLLQRGDVVVVEAFGYPPAWRLLKMAGARLHPLPVDRDGLDINALKELLAHQRVRAVLVSPYHQFPTTVTLSKVRRAQLVELAQQYGFAIIEDDYDHDFEYDGMPIPPIASGVGYHSTIYVSSLSNLLMPGAGMGFVIAPPPVFERLASLRTATYPYGDSAMQCAIAELLKDGELLRHVNRMRSVCRSRRDALATSLARHLGSAVQFRVPGGGVGLWVQVDDAIDVKTWSHAGEAEGVQFFGASAYDFLQREQPYLRLSFSYHDEIELEAAVIRMARALKLSRKRDAVLSVNVTTSTMRFCSG